MDESHWGIILKVIGAIALMVMLDRACGGKEMYPEPDPMDYDSMAEYQRDKRQYDKDYQQMREDYEFEHSNDNNW